MFGLSRDVFVWLIAVRLFTMAVWWADADATSNEGREMVWGSEAGQAYWSAERARWAEEEAQQDAAWFGAREELPADEVLGPEPEPPRAPDLDEREFTRSLAEGYPTRYCPSARLPVRTRMGPRPEDIFVHWWND